MNMNEKEQSRRLERCQDCTCLVESDDENNPYFCDEYEKFCGEIERCGEWVNEPEF